MSPNLWCRKIPRVDRIPEQSFINNSCTSLSPKLSTYWYVHIPHLPTSSQNQDVEQYQLETDEGGRGMMAANVYDWCSAGFRFRKIFRNTFCLGLIKNRKSYFGVIGEFRVPGAIPSRLSSSNRVQSQRKNQALTPISLFYCGKSAGSFNRRLFSGELEGLHEGSEHCLSVCWGNTGPSQRRGLSRSLSTDLKQLVSLSQILLAGKVFFALPLWKNMQEKQLFLKRKKDVF